MNVADIIVSGTLILGTIFCVIGGIGLLRLPDVYSRMHGAGITDTLGAGLVLVGLILIAIFSGSWMVMIKLIFIWALLLLSSPTATHAVARAAQAEGFLPQVEDSEDAP